MAFRVPFVSDVDKWKTHFLNMAEQGTKPKQFYANNPKKRGSGDDPIVFVSPSQQSVARAKSEMKYKRQQEEESDHSSPRGRKSNIKKTKHDGIQK